MRSSYPSDGIFAGITIHKMMYMITPAKAVKNVANTYAILNKVGSQPKYSAIPAHTPAIMRLEAVSYTHLTLPTT